MEMTDCVVIGAGVIGLAVARELAMAGLQTVIVEQHPAIGMETSSRNSEVIHAGIHYPAGSLKARFCVRGRGLLYDYCERRGVAYRRCGKLIVAAHRSQFDELDQIATAAHRNGVTDLVRIDRQEARALEPALECERALLSPSTGIIDTHGYMLALLGDAEAHGAVLACRSPVGMLKPVSGGIALFSADESSAPLLQSRWLINAAGLHSVAVAASIEDFPAGHLPRAYYAKGNYFSLAGRAPFTRLVYPVPEPGGLGVHLTLDLAGQARFGPDVEWVESIDYQVDPQRCQRFYERIRSYWPGIVDGSLAPAYAGVRPKITGPGEPAVDFRIDGPREHGVAGVINLFGFESPGLTASLAIAEHVAGLVGRT